MLRRYQHLPLGRVVSYSYCLLATAAAASAALGESPLHMVILRGTCSDCLSESARAAADSVQQCTAECRRAQQFDEWPVFTGSPSAAPTSVFNDMKLFPKSSSKIWSIPRRCLPMMRLQATSSAGTMSCCWDDVGTSSRMEVQQVDHPKL